MPSNFHWQKPDHSWATGSITEYGSVKLTDREWKEFKIGQLFSIEQGKGRIDKDNMNDDSSLFPIATASTTNNCILGYSDEQEARIRVKNTITIGRQTGVAFYQPRDYYETDNILILSSKMMSELSSLFIVAAFNNSTASKYSYGRVASIGKVKDEIISLPVDITGQPDYDFMEEYIKSLPYSLVIQEN